MNILIVGATGLVGQGALDAALRCSGIDQVSVLVRRPLPNADPRLRVIRLNDFTSTQLDEVDLGQMDACIYCAGALPLGMPEAAYAALTVDMTLNVARAYAAANPTGRFVYVSGAGANARSRLMPLRIKGLAEIELRKLPIPCVLVRPAIVRPAAGAASPHAVRRWAYWLSKPLLTIANTLAPGYFTSTAALGQALVRAATAATSQVIENSAIKAFE